MVFEKRKPERRETGRRKIIERPRSRMYHLFPMAHFCDDRRTGVDRRGHAADVAKLNGIDNARRPFSARWDRCLYADAEIGLIAPDR